MGYEVERKVIGLASSIPEQMPLFIDKQAITP